MQGMTFGMDGPQITGWWVNPKTGDKFKAVDTYFEDNNLIIKTSDGRMLRYDQIQNYIQTDNPDSVPTQQQGQQGQQASDEIPANILAELEDSEEAAGEGLLIPDDNIYGNKPVKQAPSAELGNIYREEEAQLQPAIQDFAIIDRALTGKDTPSLNADITWDQFPKREVEMLVDVMNISEEEIIQYYINKVSMNTVKDMVAEGIRHYIHHALHDDGTNGQFVASHVKVTSGPELDRMIEEATKKKQEEEQYKQGLVVDPNKVPKSPKKTRTKTKKED
jgi:hypothetical protein